MSLSISIPRKHRKFTVYQVGGTTYQIRSMANDSSGTFCFRDSNSKFYYTTDPTAAANWTVKSGVGSGNGYCMGYYNSTWLWYDDSGGYRATAPSGTWTSWSMGSSGNRYDVGWDGTYFIGCGYDSSYSLFYTATSAGGTWTSNTNNRVASARWISAAYYNGLWVRGGTGGNLQTATDPSGTWTTRTSGFSTSNINFVLYAAGYWVIAGQAGKVSVTDDPTGTWTSVSTGYSGSKEIRSLVYGNGRYFLTGEDGILTCVNPSATWTRFENSFTGGVTIWDIKFDSTLNCFVAVADNSQVGYLKM